MPAATQHPTPFAAPEAAPPPRVILLAHTDLESYSPSTLLMHEDLSLGEAKNAAAIAPAHTYPPAPIEKIESPSRLSRILLEKATEWKEGAHLANQLKDTVRGLAGKYLDLGYSHSKQEERQLVIVYREAAKAHPQLKKYADNWPVRCVLMAHLKITSREATKRKTIEKDVQQEERAVQKEVRAVRKEVRARLQKRKARRDAKQRRRDQSESESDESESSLTSLCSE